jgi:Fe-S-cluster-containing hydrogenase component 2
MQYWRRTGRIGASSSGREVKPVITIDAELCTGCGACVEVCPEGAIYLVDDRATADASLCSECERCITACPAGAIHLITQPQVTPAAPMRAMTASPERETVRVNVQAAPEPLRAKVLPVMGAALAWAGRELVPRLAEYLLYRLDDKAAAQRANSAAGQAANGSRPRARGGGGGGQRRRHRHRGGT